MQTKVQFEQFEVVLSGKKRASLILEFDQYSRLIIGSKLVFDAPNLILFEDSIKELMKRGREDNVNS